MRITYFKITGYSGIYTGLGLNELEIDLSNSLHKIIVISGLNGCGKSTLLKALNVLPDDSSMFRDNGLPAIKEIKLQDGIHTYEICIKSGKKIQTKCSLKKDGMEINPNGNVTSYKEAIFSEFDMDPNYISLSRISGDDRGLADMSPSERKKFMAFIIDTLGSYNDMYKILNKKSSIFKSHINTLHTKIQNIGDEENIINGRAVLMKKREEIKTGLEGLNNSIVEAQTIINMNDNSLQYLYDKHSELTSEIESLNISYKNGARVIDNYKNSLNIKAKDEELDTKYVEDLIYGVKTNRDKFRQLKSDTSIVKNSLIEKREFTLSRISDLERKRSDLLKGVDLTLYDTITEMEIKVQDGYDELSASNINPDTASETELKSLICVITDVIEIITTELYVDMTDHDLERLFEIEDYKKVIEKATDDVENLKIEISKTKLRLGNLYNDRDTLQILDNRPKNCSIDDCFFLGEACKVQAKYINKSVETIITKEEANLLELQSAFRFAEIELNSIQMLNEKNSILKRVYSICKSSNLILDKYPLGQKFSINLSNAIKNSCTFNEFKEALDALNAIIITLTLYKRDKKALDELTSMLNSQQNSEKMIEEMGTEIQSLKESISDIDDELKITQAIYDSHCKQIEDSDARINELMNLLMKIDEYQKTARELNEKIRELDDITYKNKARIDLMDKINNYKNQALQLEPKLSEVELQISNLNNQLVMLDSYKNEFAMYKDKHNMIEVLKKHCSPTSGIQTLFIDLYMGKTLDLANQVVDMVFDGQFKLLPFVISPTEFSIPFSANGLPVNDISFGSTSQICMMGMAINLVLLYQASAKYNIATLDEIDGGLDNANRMKFIPAIYKTCDILGLDQLFMISHSLELELNNVDRIILKSDSTDIPEGNILYNFNETQHQINQ